MTGRLWGDRRAEAFQNALDGHVDLTEHELVEFVRLAHELRDLPPASLGNEARRSIRARLVAEADTVLQPSAPAPAPPRPRRRAVRAIAGSTAAAAALSAGLVTVSADALPGDILYPIKRGVEQLELTFGGGIASAGSMHLDHASERLGEATTLAKSGGDSDQISGALRDFTTDTRSGTEQLLRTYASENNPAAIDDIRTFTRGAAQQLRNLAPMLGESTDAAFTQAVKAVEGADRRAIAACPTCAGGPAVQVPYMTDPIGRLEALPRDTGRDDGGNDSGQNDFLADPQTIPKGTTLPDIDGNHQDHQQGDNSNDTSGPKLQGDNGSDDGSSSLDESDPDLDLGLGDGTGTDEGVVDLPDLPDLPDTDGGIRGQIDLGPVEAILDPVQDLLDKLGPLGDVLGPVLGDDDSKSEKDDDSKGPLDGLLGPGTRENRGKDKGESKTDKLEPHQDQAEQTTPEDDADDGNQDGQNDDGPLDDLVGPVDETDEAPDVDEDGLGGLTGGDEGGTTDGGSTP